jgi:hypothetical protein
VQSRQANILRLAALLVSSLIRNETAICVEARVSKAFIIGWIIELVGMALWVYGYFVAGNPSLIDWHANTPWWIADFLPNIESEVGMALVFVAMVPIYWPSQRP